MKSKDLNRFDFSIWNRIEISDYEANKRLILGLPKSKGVYVIRTGNEIPRLKGKSDIIYIGEGIIQHRLQAILRSYLPIPYRDYMNKHTAREDIERVIKEQELYIEISYKVTKNEKEAAELESKLLQDYQKDHIEPPPLNNTRT